MSSGDCPSHWIKTRRVGGDVEVSSLEFKMQRGWWTGLWAINFSGEVSSDAGGGP